MNFAPPGRRSMKWSILCKGEIRMRRILVCEDEDAIRELIMINLQRAGYESVGAASGEEADKFFAKEGDFDVALLDVMLPGIDGFEVCRRLRSKSQSLGIIMLTAKTQETDKINGLMIGADDYVTKPFSPSELTARVDALLRRIGVMKGIKRGVDNEQSLVSGPFELDLKSRALYKDGDAIELTQVEFQIMEMFLRNKGAALKRSVILKNIWGDSTHGDEKIVDVNIRRIRMKIEKEPSNPEFLHTIWGFGYRWQEN